MMAAEPEIRDNQLARELVDRCIKAEVAEQLSQKRENLLYNAVRNALRAKTSDKSQAILSEALAAYDHML